MRDEIEVGHYIVGDGNTIMLYVNLSGVCVFRERVALVPDLPRMTMAERLAMLRRLWGREDAACTG